MAHLLGCSSRVSGALPVRCQSSLRARGLAFADGGAALEGKGYDPLPGFAVWARVGWKRVE